MSARNPHLSAPMRKTLTALASPYADAHYTKSSTGSALVKMGLATFVRGGEYIITEAGRAVLAKEPRVGAAERATIDLVVAAATAAVRLSRAQTACERADRAPFNRSRRVRAETRYRDADSDARVAGKALDRALSKTRGGK